MNKFKIKLPKIILTIILISVLVFNIMTTKSYSASVIVETDSKTINNNYEFNYKLNFGETIVTTDFILEFDSNYVEFLGVDTENTDYNQLGNGKFIILYVDEEGNGTRNIDIHFKAKIGNFDENTKTEIKVTDINAYALNRGASYSTEDFNLSNTSMFVSKYVPDNRPNDEENDNSNVGNVDDNKNQDNNGGQVIINNYYYGYDYNTGSINNNGNNNNNNNNNSNNNSGSQNNNNSNDKDKYVVYDVGSVNNYNNNSDKNKDSTYLGTIQITTPEQVDEESGDMPFTGTKSSTLATVLLIILIIHTIYVFFKAHNNKMNYYIVFALGIILLGTLDTYAVGNIFIKNFDRIKNYENLIVIMPDLDNRNIKKSDFVAIQESNNLKVVKVMDKESDIIGNNDLISTGHIAYSDDKVYHNILVYGDVNGDGNVNSSDIAEIIVNQKNNVELNGLVRKAANVYNKDDLEDKVIDNEDIYVLKQYTLRTLSGSLVKNLPEELPRGISIVYNRPEMEVNDQQQLSIEVIPNNMSVDDIVWTSNNEKILTVDENGNITGVREGKAKLTATTNDGNYKATCNVTVVKETINVENISLNTNKLTVKEGQSENLITTIEPTNSTNQEVTWTSSNTDVVDVDTNGKILAKKEGVSVITVRTKDGYKEAKCEVTVTKISRPVTGLTLSETSLILNEKDTYNLVATVLPVDADNRSVKWMSMDTKVAEVDSNGKITAKAAGNTTIIVTTVEGGIIKTCNVKVNKVTKPVTGVTLNETSITLKKDNKVNLLVNIEPFDADNQEVKWTSSNHSVATVNSNGEVTARGVGNTTITVTTVDGRYTATCEVIVIEQEEPPIEQPIEVTEVTLDKTSLELELNDTDTLIATVYPENADNKNVVWSSNNQSIVSVNETGELKAMGPGTAIITVTTENNEKTAFCTVTVKESSGPSVIPVSYVAINESLLNLRIGETGNLIATVYPEDATNKNVIWSSSRESVATVDQDGKVTAISSGTAYITVTTVDGNHISTCRATVAELPIIEPEVNVELNKANMELEIGDESELSVIVTPDNQYEDSFECNDANTVELKKQDNKMFIVGKKAGTVTIVVKITVDGKEYVRECIVTVKGDNSEVQEEVKVSIDKTELKLHAGESSDITINVTPSKPMQYSVSNINPKVVECKLENGIITVTGVDEGTTELHIKVIVDDKEYDFGCNVIVEKSTILNSLRKLFRLK